MSLILLIIKKEKIFPEVANLIESSFVLIILKRFFD